MSDTRSSTREDRLPLILLPGMHGAGDLYRRFLRALPARIAGSVIAYPNDRILGYDDLLPFVEERLPAGRFVLLGDSFSGPLAVRIAARYPDRVPRLILSNTFVSSPLPPLLRPFRRLVRAVTVGLVPMRFAVRFLLLNGEPKESRARLVGMLRRIPHGVVAARIREATAVDVREDFARVGSPVLVLSASRDRLVRSGAAGEMLGLRPEIEVRTFDSPHAILYARGDEAAAAVVRFIEEPGPSYISQP